MAVGIGAIIAKGEVATMIAVGRNTMTKAVIDADIKPPRGALGPKAPSYACACVRP
jgi:hypothetical protein